MADVCLDAKYWIFGGYVLATCLHQGGISALQRYCKDEKRYRLKFSHFNDMAMKVARTIYFTMIGIPLFSYMVSRLVFNGFIDGFYADRFLWGNVAMFCIAFDVYELSQLRGMAKGFAGQKGRIAHHVLELAITLSWYTNYPSPMLVFAGGYVVVANCGFIFPVLIRLFAISPTTQARFAFASIVFIFGSMLITDACIIWFLATYWSQTSIPRVISAVAFAVGFTSLDAVLCRGYFWPLVQKARAGKLYSPPPRPAKLIRLSSSRSNLDTWIQEGTDMFTIHSLGSPVRMSSSVRPLIKIPRTSAADEETITTPKEVELSPLTVTGRDRTVTFVEQNNQGDDNEQDKESDSSAFGSKEDEEMLDQVNSRINALLANKRGNNSRRLEKCPPTDARRNGDFDLPTDPANDSTFVFSDDSRMFTDDSGVFSDRSTMLISQTSVTDVNDINNRATSPEPRPSDALVSGVNYSPLPPEQRAQTRYPERPEDNIDEDADSEWSKRSQELNSRATMQLVEFAKSLPTSGGSGSASGGSVHDSDPASSYDDSGAAADSAADEISLNTSPFAAHNHTIYAHVPVIIPESEISTEPSSSDHTEISIHESEMAIHGSAGADEKEVEDRSRTHHRVYSSSQPLSGPTSLSSRSSNMSQTVRTGHRAVHSLDLQQMSQTVRTHHRAVHSLDLQKLQRARDYSPASSVRSHRSLHSLELERDSPFNSQSRRSGSSRGSQIIRLPETFEAPPAAPLQQTLSAFATAGKDEVVSQ